jgi:hypothetical protein
VTLAVNVYLPPAVSNFVKVQINVIVIKRLAFIIKKKKLVYTMRVKIPYDTGHKKIYINF